MTRRRSTRPSSQDRPSASRRYAPRPAVGGRVETSSWVMGDEAEQVQLVRYRPNVWLAVRLVCAGSVEPLMGDLTRVDFGGTPDMEDSHPAGKGVPPKDRALLEVTKWSSRLDLAREEYAKALFACRRHGWTYTEIGTAVGKTEAAVRRMIKRRLG